MVHDPRHLVEAGYDSMAEAYLASKAPLNAATEALLEALVADLEPTAAVLELGCGAGVPVTRWLTSHAVVTGVDLSAVQLSLAARHAPGARLIKADMTTIVFPPASFAAVVALYSIIHVPRTEHASLLERIHRWLEPGGRLLATWAIGAWEGEESNWEGWGAPMWWSHHDAATNLRLLEQAGFRIERIERHDDQESWLWILAGKVDDVGGGRHSVAPTGTPASRSG